jgi:hypothetical protein
MIVNAAMPPPHDAAGRCDAPMRCRRDHRQEYRAEQRTGNEDDEYMAARDRQHRRDRKQSVQQRHRLSAAIALQQPRPQPRRRDDANAEDCVEGDDRATAQALFTQQRDDERHEPM